MIRADSRYLLSRPFEELAGAARHQQQVRHTCLGDGAKNEVSTRSAPTLAVMLADGEECEHLSCPMVMGVTMSWRERKLVKKGTNMPQVIIHTAPCTTMTLSHSW